MFEEIRQRLNGLFGSKEEGFVIRINQSPENIETCEGNAVEDKTTRTCAICVALNDTVFKNDNKPEYRHPHCKCRMQEYELTEATFDFPIKKITGYLFVNENKKAMMHSMGYTIADFAEVYDKVKAATEKKFLSGQYFLKELNANGQHFTINMILDGKRNHAGERFACHVGCVAWPYGKIKIATPIIKDKEIKA